MKRKQSRSPEHEGTEGLATDERVAGAAQDTPGRHKSSSSRQQTQPGQEMQTGSRDLDAPSQRGDRRR